MSSDPRIRIRRGTLSCCLALGLLAHGLLSPAEETRTWRTVDD